jgi:hypothetical protein
MGDQDELTVRQLDVTVKSMRTWAETLKNVLRDSPDLPDEWVEPADQMLRQMTSLEEKFSQDLERKFKVDPQDEVNVKIRIFGRSCDRYDAR